MTDWRVLLQFSWGLFYDYIDSASAALLIKGSSWKTQDSLHHTGCQQKLRHVSWSRSYRNEAQTSPKVGIALESMSNFNQVKKVHRIMQIGTWDEAPGSAALQSMWCLWNYSLSLFKGKHMHWENFLNWFPEQTSLFLHFSIFSIFSSLLIQIKSIVYNKTHFYTIYVSSPKGMEVSYTA